MIARSATSNRMGPVMLVAISLLWLAPLYLFIANAVRPATDFDGAKAWEPPTSFDLWSNIADAWAASGMGSSVVSTLIYSTLSPVLAVLIGALAGYAIVVLRVRHGFAWFTVIFGATVLPVQMLLIPLFVNYARLGLYDTHLGLILVYTALSVPFSAFVMRNFFTGIARAVYEAALLDGASAWKIFSRIYVRMSWPALAAIFILQFTFVWNELVVGLTLTSSDSVRPLMPALMSLQSTYGGSTVPVALAGGLFVSLPTVALFLVTQRLFVRGLALGQ